MAQEIDRSKTIAAATVATVLLAVLPYLNGVHNGFTFDDVSIVAENPGLRSAAGVGAAFTTDWWSGKRAHSLLYRPLATATFAVDYAAARAGETDPPGARLPDRAAFPFHVQNVLWHAAASVALLLMVVEWFASPGLAFVTAALFAIHPVHAEAVNGIVGRAELMSACFAFIAIGFTGRVMRGGAAGWRAPIFAGLFLLLGLLSKEQAIVVPAIPVLWLALLPPHERRSSFRHASVRVLFVAFAAAVIAYLVLRFAALGTLVGVGATTAGAVNVDNPIASADGLGRWLSPIRVFGHVVRLIVFPRTLSADYSYDQIPVTAALDAATLAGVVALTALVTGAVVFRRRAPAASFGIVLFLVAWSLTSNVALTIGTILGERLLYLPSAGACVAAAAGLLAAGKSLRAPWLPAAATVALVVLGAGRTFARNPMWKSNFTLFESTAADAPRSCKVQNGFAAELFMAGNAADARIRAERALAIYPQYPDAHQTLSKVYRVLANAETDHVRRAALRNSAREEARRLIETFSAGVENRAGLADAWNTLGAVALDEDKPQEALEHFQKSLGYDARYVASLNGAGVALSRLAAAEPDAANRERLQAVALERFERALQADPADAVARQNAAEALRAVAAGAADRTRREELLGRAQEFDERAMAERRDQGDAESIANLHGVRGERLLGEKRLAEAMAEFREAARLEPGAARAHLGIGAVLAAQADDQPDPERRQALVKQAVTSFERALALEPDNATAHLDLGIIYLRPPGDPAKVAEHFRAYLRIVPDAPLRAQMEQTIREMEGKMRAEGK